MLALIAAIPYVGAPLAAVLGLLSGPVKAAGSFIGSLAQNPTVVAAVLGAGAMALLWKEESDKSGLRAQITNPATGRAWRMDYQREHPALLVTTQSLTDLTGATRRETAAVNNLIAVGKPILARSKTIAADAKKNLAEAQRQSAPIAAANQGAGVMDRINSTDAAFLKALQ